jgi:hypothetical protein
MRLLVLETALFATRRSLTGLPGGAIILTDLGHDADWCGC